MPTEKILVFVRHAHRDTTEKSLDNGLSQKGLEQVEELKKQYLSKKLPAADYFITSPKKRCAQTLKPLSVLAKREMVFDLGIDEQGDQETNSAFVKRVEQFLTKLELLQGPVIYLCSHGDVIPVMVESLTGKSISIEKAKTVQLVLEPRWKLL